MTSITGFVVLVGSSMLLWLTLAGLAIVRKGRRDRRELRSNHRRNRYEETLLRGDHAVMVRIAEEARSIEAQVDLAVSIDAVHHLLSRERIEEIGRAAQESGLLPILFAELASRRAVTRARAALLLTRPGIPTVVGRITPLLADPDPDVRLVACSGLARMGAAEAAQALIWALEARALPAERIIERLGAPWAVETILRTLERGSAPVPDRLSAAKPRCHEADLHASLARALGIAGDPRGEPALIALLGEGAEEVRVSAARALGRVGTAVCIPSLVTAVESETWPVRAQAAKSLGALRAVAALATLERCLSDRAWWVRGNAARALRELGAPGIEALRRALGHEDRYARDRAREQLALHAVIEDHAVT
jgi:HEAT repeat protein